MTISEARTISFSLGEKVVRSSEAALRNDGPDEGLFRRPRYNSKSLTCPFGTSSPVPGEEHVAQSQPTVARPLI